MERWSSSNSNSGAADPTSYSSVCAFHCALPLRLSLCRIHAPLTPWAAPPLSHREGVQRASCGLAGAPPRPSSLVVLWSVLHLYQNHFSKVTSSSKPQLFSASSSSAALATACFLSLMAVLCTLIMQNVPVSLPSGQEPSESFGLELSTLPSTCTLLRGASFSPGFGLPWKHKCTALALTFLCVVQTSASQDFEAGFSRGRIEYQRV